MPQLLHPAPMRTVRRLKVDTLVRLRGLAVVGQCAAIAIVHFGFGYRLPIGACLLLILAAAAINIWFRIFRPASHRLSENGATLLLGFDLLQLAALLYLTGGLQNPFSILFLAPVLISAAALPPERTLVLGLLAIGCATILVLAHRKLPWVEGETLDLPFLYVVGTWTAIMLGITFTGVFAYRVSEEGRQLSEALAATELVLAREQHLSQLDGLAAAAAHELGTPLATIALVAKELDLQAAPDSPMKDDTRLLREQVERCRVILSKLTSLGSEEEGAGFLGTMTLGHLIAEVVEPHRSFGIDIKAKCTGAGPEPATSRSPGLLYGLGNLVDNAVDFAQTVIRIDARWTSDTVTVEICDDGPGFAPEVLLHAGEPYVTTRAGARLDEEGGSGLGLGLFIAKTLIERSGAQLTLANAVPPSHGAVVRIMWPRALFVHDSVSARDAARSDGTLPVAQSVPI